MKNVGHMIYLARKKAGITQRELAQGLCTSKYIYLIEKCARQPSIDMLEAMGERIGIDFFEYLPYVSCHDPFTVKMNVDLFNHLRAKRAFDQLTESTLAAAQHPDFLAFPWNAEIVYNEALVKMYQLDDFEGAKAHSFQYLNRHDDPDSFYQRKYLRLHPSIIRLYNLIAVCDIHLDLFEEAQIRFRFLRDYLKQRKDFSYYSAIAISVNINYCQTIGKVDPEKQLEAVNELIELQVRSNKLDRLYLSYHIKGSALLALGDENMAITYFQRAFFAGMALSEWNSLKNLLQEKDVLSMVEKGIFKVDLISLVETELNR